MKHLVFFIVLILLQFKGAAQEDSLYTRHAWQRKFSFGRSQHIQYLGNNKRYKTNTLFNKSYYAAFSIFNYKGLKPFISLSYEYFFTRAICYTCLDEYNLYSTTKRLHFINFASLGSGFTKELIFKNKSGKEIEIVVGASLERYLFKRAYIMDQMNIVAKTTPYTSSNNFFNAFFFKDMYGVRVYNSKTYKVFIQLSGVLLRNERLSYRPSRYTFHNFMMGFNIVLK